MAGEKGWDNDDFVLATGDTILSDKTVQFYVIEGATACATGDGKFYFVCDSSLDGYVLSAVLANCITAGTTGTMDIQIANVTDAVDILSTKLTIDSAEKSSSTAATPAVINTANDDITALDVLRVDIDAVHTTPAQGLIVVLQFTPV